MLYWEYEKGIHGQALANAAALSVFYYQRLFARLVKKPVREYIKLRRLARACDALRSGRKILDVAVEYGFGSHEVFSRAFKDAYDMTPTQYGESGVRLNNFDRPDLLLSYTTAGLGVPLIGDGLVLEINRVTLERPIKFMGVQDYVSISGHFPNGGATGVNEPGEIWRRFDEARSAIPAIPNGRKIGVAYGGDAPEGCFPYFAGAEVTAAAEEKYQVWTLPASEYLVCGFEAETFDELVTTALNKAFNMEIWALWIEEGK